MAKIQDNNNVNWNALQKEGISVIGISDKEKDNLLRQQQTGLVSLLVTIQENGQKKDIQTKGKLYIVSQKTGEKTHEGKDIYEKIVKAKTIQKELSIPDNYLGHSFSEQEKEKLKKGEVIPITIESKFGFSPAKDETGTAEPKMEKVLMSVDPELNRLVTVKTSNFKLSTIKGVELSEQNKQDLLEGKKVTLENMELYGGKIVTGDVQINPSTNNISFQNIVPKAIDLGALMSTGKKIPIAQKIESVKSQVQDQQKEIQQKQQQQKLTPKKNQGFKK